MQTLDYIAQKFNVDISQESPIFAPNINPYHMAETFNELQFKVGAEIGVERGKHAFVLCNCIPDLKLYCIDVWEVYEGNLDYAKVIKHYYTEAQGRLSGLNCVFVKKFSMDAVKDFSNESLDFVYIDAAHDFKNVAMDICEWAKKVKPGGIVYGHDFSSTYNNYVGDVQYVVRAYCGAKNINPWFVIGEENPVGKRSKRWGQSWMFVKE
jgi:hypothetical protein